MTTQITRSEVMTGGQRKQIKRSIEDTTSSKNLDEILDELGFSKDEAQEVLEKGDLVQEELKNHLIATLKKYAVIDNRFGPALVEFDITVPADYKHDKVIDRYGKEVKKLKTTYSYNDALTSENFENAMNQLQPGKTYRAKINPILKTITSEDCLNFLKRQRAILVGGQGLMLAHSLHKDQFPVGKWTISFDQKEALWKDSGGRHRVPSVFRFSDSDWWFDHGIFEDTWLAGHCLLCLCDK